jgi:hypothetical protein
VRKIKNNTVGRGMVIAARPALTIKTSFDSKDWPEFLAPCRSYFRGTDLLSLL